MLFVRVKSRIGGKISPSVVRCGRRRYSVPATSTEQDEPKSPPYPPILDLSAKAKMLRKRETWANEMQNLPTIEQKMIKINMPRYYGWKSVLLNEGVIPYNSNAQMQYLTKTHVVEKPGLPSYYDRLVTPEKLKATVEKIKESLEDGLVFEYADRNRSQELDKSVLECPRELDNVSSKAISRQVHRILMTHLAPDNPYLLETEIDHDPRIEAFWFVGGLPTPPIIKVLQTKVQRLPKEIHEVPVDRAIQYLGKPNFQLRHHLPLPELIPLEESEDPNFTVPEFKYNPRSTGLYNVRRHGTNIPGFWPGDTSEFGFLSYHKCGHLARRPDSFNDTFDAIKVQAVLGSWGWLLSQACNLGFSTFNDVTYPLTNQMIITNGKAWTFCAYQLNTTVLHSHHMRENLRRNICWITEPMQLFEKIEDNKVHGLNTEVLENIVKFYLNEPRSRDVDLKPYVHPEMIHVANIRGPNKRAWLEERFKLMASNRPRHRRLPEIFAWQEIYLRKYKTRPLDKKREPWEFGIKEWQRKLDDHCPRYIPKCLRKTKKQKWEPTFYP